MNKLWFRAKRFGYGWYPCSWQGWLAIIVWAALFALAMAKMDHEWLKNLLFIFLITALLIYICYKKGEKARWSWSSAARKTSTAVEGSENLFS